MICLLSAIPMRKEPSDRSEMVNQIIYGESMAILEEIDKWTLVRLDHDQYEGWVDKKQISPLTTEYTSLDQAEYVNDLFLEHQLEKSEIYLPAGSLISKGVIKVGAETKLTRSLEHIAHMFLGTPYLWGGRTFMGIDCSGYTQIVFRLIGINLPRDAYQQAEIGESVMFVEESQTGDLAFFKNDEGRISHVGIIVKKSDRITGIIHASGKVRIDKLDHEGIFNEDTGSYSHSLRIIKRQLK